MDKWIRPKHYKCTGIIETGSLSADMISMSVERKLTIDESSRKHTVTINIHSIIQRPDNLEGVLLEIGLIKSSSLPLVCHEDEEYYGIGVFNHYTASTPEQYVHGPHEFCHIDIAYEEEKFYELVEFLTDMHFSKAVKLMIDVEVLGLREDCTWDVESGGLIVTDVSFRASSHN
ncbi:MAG TPA: hypothetical protein ENI99_00475 [Sedimenticola sp.]|nr:hypothetical protein [Sedimenticola sp.]